MSYNKTIIYFMSGTGNSYRIAQTIGDTAKNKGLSVEVNPISLESKAGSVKSDLDKKIEDNEKTLLGLAMPTHGFTAPFHMIRFARRLPRRKNTHAISVTTCAGSKAGNKIIMGLSASANFVIAIILRLKGYKVQGFTAFDMPSNWMSVHPSYPAKSVELIVERTTQKAANFMEKILSGKKQIATGRNLYDLILGIALLPISVAYTLIGRFFLGKIFFANNKCNSCGICADHCLVGAIKMRGTKKPWPYWRWTCENCMRCMAFCPKEAIEAGHSWGAILYYITAIPASIYIFNFLGQSFTGISELKGHWIGDLINFIYFYPAIFISYFVFYFLTKIPPINTLFTYTTLTHIYKRYREPGTKLKELSKKEE